MSWMLLWLCMTIGVAIGSLVDLFVLQNDVERVFVIFVAIEFALTAVVITGAIFMGGKVW